MQDDQSCSTCNRIVEASSTAELATILRQQLDATEPSARPAYLFFDLDECMLMPATPFIDGLPGSDALTRKLVLCGDRVLTALRREMTEAYYEAPLKLVDDGFPYLISYLRARHVVVYGLTSRGTKQGPFTWHNEQISSALASHCVRFSELPAEHLGVHGANTKAGGVLYAGGSGSHKAALMQRITRGAPSTLVDNSAGKLVKATSVSRACIHGIHFTAAWSREASDSERRQWITNLRLRVDDNDSMGI